MRVSFLFDLFIFSPLLNLLLAFNRSIINCIIIPSFRVGRTHIREVLIEFATHIIELWDNSTSFAYWGDFDLTLIFGREFSDL